MTEGIILGRICEITKKKTKIRFLERGMREIGRERKREKKILVT